MPLAPDSRYSILRPDDWHLHLRDLPYLAAVLPHTAKVFGRAIVMPNLTPPVNTVAAAQAYRERILALLDPAWNFEPLMTLFLENETSIKELTKAKESAFIYGAKLYPASVTTNSERGVREIQKMYPIFSAMEKLELPLLIHGEVNDRDLDIFAREKVFIERHLQDITRNFPKLKIVLEHISTTEAVHFVLAAGECVGATITAHHLLLNRNAIFEGGLRPHHYCLPLLKTERDRQALLKAATSGKKKFFLGTDSAPHSSKMKEHSCGCAGIYTAHCALELYAEIFDEMDAIHHLEAFASINGAAFYGLPRHKERITLVKKTKKIPPSYPFGDERCVGLRAGESVAWSIEAL